MQERTNISKIKTGIIPVKQHFLGEKKTLDKEAICVFVATGFFLDQVTYYKEQKVLKPACIYDIDARTQEILSEESYFKWHYSPVDRPFKQIVDEFAELFETIIKEQVEDKKVIYRQKSGKTNKVFLKNKF